MRTTLTVAVIGDPEKLPRAEALDIMADPSPLATPWEELPKTDVTAEEEETFRAVLERAAKQLGS